MPNPTPDSILAVLLDATADIHSATMTARADIACITDELGQLPPTGFTLARTMLSQRRDALADDVVAESALALAGQLLIAPAMNHRMWLHPATQANVETLKARGAIIGGSAWADRELNTPTSIAAGNLYIDYDFTGVYPAHHITMRRHMTNKYLADIFG
jgi:phage tail sheath protein FI